MKLGIFSLFFYSSAMYYSPFAASNGLDTGLGTTIKNHVDNEAPKAHRRYGYLSCAIADPEQGLEH
jgi:hypothetical protein